jgi:diadenosine tetraphosphate (Ap4A) HIT family hydrolase
LSGISKANEQHIEILGRLLLTAKKIGDILKIQDGYRIVINDGKHAGQTVSHLHLHFLAGRQFSWPPGTDSSNPKV